MQWKEAIFVLRSKKRKKILELFEKEPRNPSTIAKLLNDHKSTASRSIKQLAEKGFLECINPKDRNFRLYKITQKGIKTLKQLKKVSDS